MVEIVDMVVGVGGEGEWEWEVKVVRVYSVAALLLFARGSLVVIFSFFTWQLFNSWIKVELR